MKNLITNNLPLTNIGNKFSDLRYFIFLIVFIYLLYELIIFEKDFFVLFIFVTFYLKWVFSGMNE